MPELQLERALRELGTELSIPVERPLAAAVARRLREEPVRRLGRPLWRRPVVIGLVVLAAALAATLAVEPARTALLELLRIGGVSVERVDRLPEVRPDAPLGLGDRVSLGEARSAVGFPVLVPSDDPPDAVFLSRGIPGGAVSLLYGDEDEPRLLVTQFRGSVQPDFIKKSAAGTRFSSVLVRGVEGYWLSGAPHSVVFRDENGVIRTDRNRLAEEVLLWVEDGVTFRLEGQMALVDAFEIAESLR